MQSAIGGAGGDGVEVVEEPWDWRLAHLITDWLITEGLMSRLVSDIQKGKIWKSRNSYNMHKYLAYFYTESQRKY